jgi:hypothetical protein
MDIGAGYKLIAKVALFDQTEPLISHRMRGLLLAQITNYLLY